MAHDAHSVLLRLNNRPEKWRAGRQTTVSSSTVRALIPVEFDDAVVGYAPRAQVGTDTERHEERGPLGAGQREDGVDVEMVVVVVADDHGVERGQPFQFHRRRMQPMRADDVRRRARSLHTGSVRTR